MVEYYITSYSNCVSTDTLILLLTHNLIETPSQKSIFNIEIQHM